MADANWVVGIVGAGGIAQAHIPAWQAEGAQVVLYSPYDGVERIAEKVGARAVHSYEELLETVDGVDICSPTPTHRDYVLAAAAAGRHVLCEKPLALEPADALEMIEACEAAGVQLYPAHVVRFFPEYALMRQRVAAGDIGRPAILRFSRTGRFPGWSPWFGQDELSGGLVTDQMIHDLDIARWVAGPVDRVYAVENSGGSVRMAMVTLTHGSGALSHVHGVWGLPETKFRTSFEVSGDKGILRYDSAADQTLRVELGGGSGGGEAWPSVVTTMTPYHLEIAAFYAAFRGGPVPRVSARDGLVAVELAAAARESMRSGSAVDFVEGGAK
ncbi:Gfo/Idh/MocA family protein [Fodinicola acaciae]|uniref:Gfo/Idh/MocA family protein n=1 Tax=Fodinicola acaciae TaxID=2681555 RepID=UPI001C9E21A1|nr:Gfo/Idh/MocA family oxidoreductase [Fodinicola acaciae]